MNKLIVLAACLLAVVGCTKNNTNEQANRTQPEQPQQTAKEPQPLSVLDPGASFEDVYKSAEAALAIAESKRNVWSSTEGLLKEAMAARSSGSIEEAVKLAHEARLQAELASSQADTEKEAWRSRILSK